MKAVILAGGMGTRLQEETTTRPKPMVEIGGKPILWHIMKQYAHHGIDDFVVALGYLGNSIKSWFLDRQNLGGNLEIDFRHGTVNREAYRAEDWSVNLVETGQKTMTGGRLLRLKERLEGETFLLTYGDGVSDVDITSLLKFHRSHGKLATVTAVRPPARFGGLNIEGDLVASFTEKPIAGEGWINGGFFVFESGIFDYLTNDSSVLETAGLENAAADGQLAAYQHEGFWQCMDTLREKNYLESLWSSGNAPWKTWEDEKPASGLRLLPGSKVA